MTVWRPPDRRTYRYRFYLLGRQYAGNTQQTTEADAKEWEEAEQRRLRRAAGGLGVLPEHSPKIRAAADAYLKDLRARGRVRRIDHVAVILRVVLRFWGGKPVEGAVDGEPYHDLRLLDPIRDPTWLVRFEAWMDARTVRGGRPLGAQSKKHYISMLSRVYRWAMQPRQAVHTGVQVNPFAALERPRTVGRKVSVTPAELRRWLAHTPRHAQLAIAIAALAPKLRLANVLALRWHLHVDAELRYLTIAEHKTQDVTGAPLVVPISGSLAVILAAARAQRTSTTAAVITYRGQPVKSIRHAVRTGAEAAGLVYGRDVPGGVTFHTIRHTAATLLAEVPHLTEAQRAATMGQDIQTTQGYTHLRPARQRPVLQRLAGRLQLDAIMAEAFGTAAPGPAVPPVRRPRKAPPIVGSKAPAGTGRKARSGQ